MGRFGVGFNATYHLTDVPAFVSGDFACWLDPHMRYLDPRLTEPGARVKFSSSAGQKLVAKHPDQFAPFQKAFGCDLRHHFKVKERERERERERECV